jgi:ABC-type thiamine transport system substrate-binding protein
MKLGKGAAYKLSSAKKATVDSIADVQPTPTPTSSSWREENSVVVFDTSYLADNFASSKISTPSRAPSIG